MATILPETRHQEHPQTIVLSIAGAAALIVIAYTRLRERAPETGAAGLRAVRDLDDVVIVCVKAVEGIVDVLARQHYLGALGAATTPGSIAIIATFAPDGPQQCSGLPVDRYDTADLAGLLGRRMATPQRSPRGTHHTRWRGTAVHLGRIPPPAMTAPPGRSIERPPISLSHR